MSAVCRATNQSDAPVTLTARRLQWSEDRATRDSATIYNWLQMFVPALTLARLAERFRKDYYL
jgi:hypothetical protein